MRNNVNEPWKHDVKWKKPDAKDNMLYDSIYVKFLDEKQMSSCLVLQVGAGIDHGWSSEDFGDIGNVL